MYVRIIAALGALLALGAAAGDGPERAGDPAGTRFSPLADIDAGNVASLAEAWRSAWRPTSGGSAAAPIAIGGVLYIAARDAVVAIGGDTGRLLWRHSVPQGVAGGALSWWPGDGTARARLFYATPGGIVALNPRTGAVDAGFAANGRLALDAAGEARPVSFRNVLIVAGGDLRGFNARTGAALWRFPLPPRPAPLQAAPAMVVDEDNGTLFAAAAGGQPGDASGTALLALDAGTGRLRWRYPLVRGEAGLADGSLPLVLVDVTVRGQRVPAVAVLARRALLHIVDRGTGRAVFGVAETPVAGGDLPGARRARTQPIPRRPEPLARVSWTPADIVAADETSLDHAEACRALVARHGGLLNTGPFTPPALPGAAGAARASIDLPPHGGAAGSAADPRRGQLFFTISEGGSIDLPQRRAKDGSTPAGTHSVAFAAPFRTPGVGTATLPCLRPPWGRLVAVDGNDGRIAWATRLGVSDTLPPGQRATGRADLSGAPIATAGELVFVGATDDRRFRAFDARSGRELWQASLPANARDTPVTYRGIDGRQYVAVAAGATLIAFALPR